MALYCGIDLHSNNSYVAVRTKEGEDVLCRRLRNDLATILQSLEPYRGELEAIAVESTYNWYWLVDGLIAAGYDVRLVNTTKAADYSGMKYTDDRHDARWIAHLLALGILPEGYIMPPQERSLRDLVRRRSMLVEKRTSLLLSVGTTVTRSTGIKVPTDEIVDLSIADLRRLVGEELVTESIALVLPVIRVLSQQIKAIEKKILAHGKLRPEFALLKTAPGIGDVLALTVMCETGDIRRFKDVGNYASYCRSVKSERWSNLKRKGSGNRKNGNKYLSWAYSEAAHHWRRLDPRAKLWFEHKRKRSHVIVANRALANKMARACYFVLRDQVPFDPSRMFH